MQNISWNLELQKSNIVFPFQFWVSMMMLVMSTESLSSISSKDGVARSSSVLGYRSLGREEKDFSFICHFQTSPLCERQFCGLDFSIFNDYDFFTVLRVCIRFRGNSLLLGIQCIFTDCWPVHKITCNLFWVIYLV